jgi:NAD(P)-dependent dehydrogenase (short-subunit alcohol dehydrogenase family)
VKQESRVVEGEFSLKGKTALIAGNNQRWGKHIALAVAQAGADVAVVGENIVKLDDIVRHVQGAAGKAVAFEVDISSYNRLSTVIKSVVAQYGKIDILVNANIVELAKAFTETTSREWRHLLDANLTPVVACSRAVGKYMLKRNKGRIINVTSCLAERGVMNTAACAASMGGIVSLTRALALEWAREGITVNTIGTGWFSDVEKLIEHDNEQLLRYLPLKRFGNPSELGSLVVYLASDAAGYITGQFMSVDGAVMAHL